MKCPNCNTENRDNAMFCRNCGNILEENTISIREQFPEYDFIPTTMKKVNSRSYWWVKIVMLLVLLITIIVVSITLIMFGTDGFSYYPWLDPGHRTQFYIGCFCLIPAIFVVFSIKRIYCKNTQIDVSSIVDYIEGRKESSIYKFVVKDSKFGLYNLKTMSFQIPCEFDYLSWLTTNKILKASIDGRQYEIDINGNKLK